MEKVYEEYARAQAVYEQVAPEEEPFKFKYEARVALERLLDQVFWFKN